MVQPRRRLTKDNLGRRTDRVKRREARLMRNRANDGYDPTEIAKEFGRDPRTVMAHLGLRVSAEPKEQQGDEEVLPNHIKLGIPRGELVNRLLGYRDTLFQWPAPQPDEVVEILLILRWGRAHPLLWEYLEGDDIFQEHVRSRRRYVSRCYFLMELVESELEATDLTLVKDTPLEPGKTPSIFLPTWPSPGGPPEEYIGAAMVAIVVRMMETIYDEARKQKFNDVYLRWINAPRPLLEFSPLFQRPDAHRSTLTFENSENSVEEGFLHLWWKGLLVGKVREATKPAVEEVLQRIAEEQAATSLWLEMAAEYEQIAQGLASVRDQG
ncbi:MAG: hypothetical protein O2909_08865 [Chloroflexi bacterium]|nr:hypothetical protein [Chloroflexota bacterium]